MPFRLFLPVVCLGFMALPGPAQAQWLYGRLMTSTGTQPNGASQAVDVSSDGKTVVFSSSASNWVPGDAYSGNRAVAVDLDSGSVEVVSRTMAGVVLRGEHPATSRDGR